MTPAHERLAECLRRGRICEVSDCNYGTQKWGRLCDLHDKREENTGHHSGRTIRVNELRPYRALTRPYIRKNANHPAIAAALSSLYELIYGERRPVEWLRRNATPKERLDRWMDKLKTQEVHERDALAMIAAMYLMQEQQPDAFKSDRHFRHQLVIRFLRMVRAPRVEVWSGGKASYRYDRVTVAVREKLAQELEAKVGLLCLRMARLLSQHC